MNSTPKIANMFFCSISEGKDVLFSYNGGDLELEKLASVWQEKAPAHHAWCSHTEEKRTFGFLMKDGYIYFAINDCKENLENLQFLKNLRDCFWKVCQKDEFQGELISAIHRMTSPEGMYPSLPPADHTANGGTGKSNGGLMRTRSAKSRTTEKNLNPHDRKKNKDRGIEVGKDNSNTGVKIDVGQEHIGIAISLRKSLSTKIRAQQHARILWWRHVKIVAVIDALLCLGLFVAWLVVCRGFQCLSS